MPSFSHFKDRVDFFGFPDNGEPAADLFEGVFASLINGSHVIICQRDQLDTMLSLVQYSQILIRFLLTILLTFY